MMLDQALMVFDDARDLLAAVPVFDLPDAALANDLIKLRHACRIARATLVVAPNFETGGVTPTVIACDQIIGRLTALEQQG
jgi:hypothetical protein